MTYGMRWQIVGEGCSRCSGTTAAPPGRCVTPLTFRGTESWRGRTKTGAASAETREAACDEQNSSRLDRASSGLATAYRRHARAAASSAAETQEKMATRLWPPRRTDEHGGNAKLIARNPKRPRRETKTKVFL